MTKVGNEIVPPILEALQFADSLLGMLDGNFIWSFRIRLHLSRLGTSYSFYISPIFSDIYNAIFRSSYVRDFQEDLLHLCTYLCRISWNGGVAEERLGKLCVVYNVWFWILICTTYMYTTYIHARMCMFVCVRCVFLLTAAIFIAPGKILLISWDRIYFIWRTGFL